MKKRQDRKAVYHPRSGITHRLRYFFPHIWFVAVDTTVGAGRFLLPERASIETPAGIFTEFAAPRAEIITRTVPTMAGDSYHRCNRLLLTEYSAASVVRHENYSLPYFTHENFTNETAEKYL